MRNVGVWLPAALLFLDEPRPFWVSKVTGGHLPGQLNFASSPVKQVKHLSALVNGLPWKLGRDKRTTCWSYVWFGKEKNDLLYFPPFKQKLETISPSHRLMHFQCFKYRPRLMWVLFVY